MKIHFIGKQYGITQTPKQLGARKKKRGRLKFLLTLFLSLCALLFFRETIKLIPAINQREYKRGRVKFHATIKNDVGEIDERNE
jgi:hypothetical protein